MTRAARLSVAPGVVLAEYYFDEDFSCLFVVRHDSKEPLLHFIDRPLADVRAFVLLHFQGAVAGSPSEELSTGDRIAQLDEEAFDEFFAPFVEPLLRGADGEPALAAEGETIWFVPSDALFYVPLHAVRVDGRYVIERNPVCYSPSASIMAYCQQGARRSRTRALVVGDSLGDLDHAREEAAAVASLFHTSPIVGAEATKRRVLQEIDRSRQELDVLHFSCHGYFHPSEALRSGILFASAEGGGLEGDLLTAEEIIGLKLNAELVALSACETGINERLPGDELMGLTRALLFAGSAAIMVSLWEVDDLSTGIFMNEFYRGLLGSSDEPALDKAQALQRAQNAVREMSAADVIAVCDGRLRDVNAEVDPLRALRYRVDRAEMQAIANDRHAATAAFEALDRDLSRYTDDAAAAVRERSSQALAQLRTPSQGEDWIDYEVQPFAAVYHWAPFILVGDWH